MSRIIDIQSFLKHFYKEPNRFFHVREMARLLKLNPTTASKYLNQLYKEELLSKSHELGHILFKANTESSSYRYAKIYYNIKSLWYSGLIEHLDKELHYPEAILLFGSYAKGENDENSDIDLFVLANAKKHLDLNIFEKKLRAKIQIFVKNKDEFIRLQKENKNLVNSILNGIVIKGYLEVFE